MRYDIVDELNRSAESGDSDSGTSALMARAATLIQSLRKELRDNEREYQREAREIAAEARWQAQNEYNQEPYGTY